MFDFFVIIFVRKHDNKRNISLRRFLRQDVVHVVKIIVNIFFINH